ncbi:MAG: hypothetical protein HYZ75_12665 [Elusimicrobia bacterium]|nr:hypothetical protein [Elusimicrobiota bacterium]
MPSIRLEDLSPFGRLALKLDQELSELARVGGQIARVDIGSDNGLDEKGSLKPSSAKPRC